MKTLSVLLLGAGLCLASQHKDPRDTKSFEYQEPLGKVYQAVEKVSVENYAVISQNNALHTLTVKANGGYIIGMTAVSEAADQTKVILHFIDDTTRPGWVPVTKDSKKIFKEIQEQLGKAPLTQQ
jgi:hypothetical protein